MVAEYVITAAAMRAAPVVLDVLTRCPRAPKGRGRVAVLLQRLDSLLRDPPPAPRLVDDPGPFFHGTKADLRPGDLLTPGWHSNYGSQRVANHIYLTASRDGAPLAAQLARGEGQGRVYRVEPLGTIEDDPNVTDKRFPGNPTRSYRTTEPLRVVEEIIDWTPPPPDLIQKMRQGMAEVAELGIEAMDDWPALPAQQASRPAALRMSCGTPLGRSAVTGAWQVVGWAACRAAHMPGRTRPRCGPRAWALGKTLVVQTRVNG